MERRLWPVWELYYCNLPEPISPVPWRRRHIAFAGLYYQGNALFVPVFPARVRLRGMEHQRDPPVQDDMGVPGSQLPVFCQPGRPGDGSLAAERPGSGRSCHGMAVPVSGLGGSPLAGAVPGLLENRDGERLPHGAD